MLPTGTVTLLFTDIEGSTPLWEKMPAEMQQAVALHHVILRNVIEAHDGRVFQVLGDAFQAAFRLATDGLCAAIEAQRALITADWKTTGPLKVRMGLHTGPLALDAAPGPSGEQEYAVSHTLNRAARVMSAGHGGQILMSQETKSLIERDLPHGVGLRDLGEHQLKGMRKLEHLYQVVAVDLQQDFPPLVTSLAHPHNLPAELTSLVGREKEVAELEKILIDQRARLVTITGAGGIGKTRLALRTAETVIDSFKDGVWLVELVSLADGAFIPQEMAHTLRIREVPGQPVTEALREHLSKKHLLLVLDNCEHLIQAAAELVSELLRACPDIQILATSREILGVGGEVGYICPSLLSPDYSTPDIALSTEYSEIPVTSAAVQLFAERATFAFPEFRLSKYNAATIAGICQRLDGIPLAIELAAARVRMLTVEQIAAHLDDVFHLLTGGSRSTVPHHQTLKALIDWSYNLLPIVEQTLFRRLSVFMGGWDLAAAEAVGAGDGIEDWEVLDLMAQLESKSLILVEPIENGHNRYRMLETFRQYAHNRLIEVNEQTRLEKQHLEYFMYLVEEAEPRLWSNEIEEWVHRLSLDYDNLRKALHWSLIRETSFEEVEMGARMAGCLWIFWYYNSSLKEGSNWLASALQRYLRLNQTRAKLLMSDGAVAWYLSNLQMAATRLREAFDLFSLLEDTTGLAYTTYLIGHVMFDQQNYSEARRIFKESLTYFESIGNFVFQNILFHDLGLVAYHVGDLKLAREYYERSLAYFIQSDFKAAASSVYVRLGDIARMEGDFEGAEEIYQKCLQIERVVSVNSRTLAWALLKLGFLTLNRGNINQAQSLFCESLALQYDASNQQGVAECLVGLGSTKVMSAEDGQAAVCFAAARQILTGTGQPISPADEADWKRYEAMARKRCEIQHFERAWSRGSEADIDDLVTAVKTASLDRFTQGCEA